MHKVIIKVDPNDLYYTELLHYSASYLIDYMGITLTKNLIIRDLEKSDRLKYGDGFYGFIDFSGRETQIVLDSSYYFPQVLCHEMTHLSQYEKKQLTHAFIHDVGEFCHVWDGHWYPNDHPYMMRPWEREVCALETVICAIMTNDPEFRILHDKWYRNRIVRYYDEKIKSEVLTLPITQVKRVHAKWWEGRAQNVKESRRSRSRAARCQDRYGYDRRRREPREWYRHI